MDRHHIIFSGPEMENILLFTGKTLFLKDHFSLSRAEEVGKGQRSTSGSGGSLRSRPCLEFLFECVCFSRVPHTRWRVSWCLPPQEQFICLSVQLHQSSQSTSWFLGSGLCWWWPWFFCRWSSVRDHRAPPSGFCSSSPCFSSSSPGSSLVSFL